MSEFRDAPKLSTFAVKRAADNGTLASFIRVQAGLPSKPLAVRVNDVASPKGPSPAKLYRKLYRKPG